MVLNVFKSGMFPIKNWTQGEAIKTLSPKEILQIIPIVFAQLKPGNTSEELLNTICQDFYSLYWSKEITKKVHSIIIKSIYYYIKWILNLFLIKKIARLHRLPLSLKDKINLKRSVEYIALSSLSIYYTWKA